MNTSEYLNRLYAGFLGMNIGIRLGAPVEPSHWSSERIERFYGDIHSYVKEFKNFAADDDANGPVFFLRSLLDSSKLGELQASDVAEAWLNYAREGIGMFWWGGYGVSTEHTAYLNLKAGIPAPQSGSIQINGKTLAEQIGGQIFIDTWGFLFPGDPATAATYAKIAASVSHDGEGLEGAAFIAAAIAKAFETDDVNTILDAAMNEIDSQSIYANVVTAVRAFHATHPDDWKLCLRYLQNEWGYDRYPGVCHIIPNAGVCIMALLYGQTLSRGVEIATMAGWDTDCNAGNVGSILGVAGGVDSVEDHYRKPINDFLVLSGVSGYLNILDIPTYIKHLCALSHVIHKKDIPQECSCKDGTVDFDFSLPGSTHGFRVSDPNLCMVLNQYGSLEIVYNRMVRPQKCRLYYKPFYRRKDFDDERYMPVFSPTVYAGQTMTMTYQLEKFTGESVMISPYVRNTWNEEVVLLDSKVVYDQEKHTVSCVLPDLGGAMIDEVGLLLEANSPAKNRDFGSLHVYSFVCEGNAHYHIDLSKQCKEFQSIIPFSHNHGAWELVKDSGNRTWMEAMTLDFADAMTGNYYTKDVLLKGSVICHSGRSALISLRVQGAQRGYYGGFYAGQVGLFKKVKGVLKPLLTREGTPLEESVYELQFKAKGEILQLDISGYETFTGEDSTFAHGMVGYATYDRARVGFGNLEVKEI